MMAQFYQKKKRKKKAAGLPPCQYVVCSSCNDVSRVIIIDSINSSVAFACELSVRWNPTKKASRACGDLPRAHMPLASRMHPISMAVDMGMEKSTMTTKRGCIDDF